MDTAGTAWESNGLLCPSIIHRRNRLPNNGGHKKDGHLSSSIITAGAARKSIGMRPFAIFWSTFLRILWCFKNMLLARYSSRKITKTFTSVNMNMMVQRPVWPLWRESIIPIFLENCVEAVVVLDSGQIVANVRKKICCSPAVVYELDLPHGTKLRILNTHFHHDTAKKARGHVLAYAAVLDMYASMIKRHDVHLLIGDFNQAAPKMVNELGPKLEVPIFEDCRHPALDDCMCIFSLGGKVPGHFSNIKRWQHLEGAHWPLAKHYGEKPGRTPDRRNLRKVRGRERWKKARAKGRWEYWTKYWR